MTLLSALVTLASAAACTKSSPSDRTPDGTAVPPSDGTGNSAPDTPALVAPDDGAELDAPDTLVATFTDPDPSDTGTVHFQVCADAACDTVVQAVSSTTGIANGADAMTTLTGLTGGQTYYWEAQNEDAAGSTSSWSTARSFRAGAGAGTLTFESVTGWARPAPATPSAATAAGWRLVPFTTRSGLDAAISGMQTHDYIYYAGTGVLTISNTSNDGYIISNKNPTGRVVIDFGTSKSIWNAAAQSANYVRFVYAGTGNFVALWLNADSNLTLFGGDLTTTTNGTGIVVNAPAHDVIWDDVYLHGIAESGISVRGSTTSGAASNTYNLTIRAEVNGFAMNPVFDPHADKGTGVHAMILHGNVGGIHDCTFAVYGHDTLAPGDHSLSGVVYPEGAGGSVIEQGNATQASYDNDIMYAKGVNLMMEPGHGTNPGSTGVQTGGNLFDLWGHIKLNGNVIGWAEAHNATGSVIHSDTGTWFPGTPPLTVQHGRHSNTNLYTGGSNIPQPYPTKDPAGTPLGIVYQDCQ